MELTCPCGNGILIKNVTTKGPNVTRPYYKCPGSQKGNNIPDCKFYSFEDELKRCPCGRGFCRTAFIRKEKIWCCCVQGLGDCGFMMRITSTWQLPRDWNSNPQSSSAASQLIFLGSVSISLGTISTISVSLDTISISLGTGSISLGTVAQFHSFGYVSIFLGEVSISFQPFDAHSLGSASVLSSHYPR
ncbi:uncharacterized protein [Spinacia oleracea]|uniref:GRF-type domain-containing protein n=1 Tax=Spinacia oleracea TaxID=3562 RepID=A0ABM3R272_SPIOL|nr:uncharacterized protein LOC110791062 [Spinacia oleracea]XP_056689700.1 uncharacterized protein LOC110791062 [Spinacia oleracea]